MSLFSEYPGLKRVPNFVGLNFDASRQLQSESGWAVRDPDPDAPPITNYWWDNKELIVASQIPAAGSLLHRDERVGITLKEPQGRTAAGTAPIKPLTLDDSATHD